MSSIIKVLFVLSAMVCISTALFHESGSQCLCSRLWRFPGSRSEIKDIQIYPATIFCGKVEILVTKNDGSRYCLNPSLKAVKRILSNIMRKQKASTARPTELSSAAGSTNMADI